MLKCNGLKHIVPLMQRPDNVLQPIVQHFELHPYNLKPIEQVKRYINENNHLEGIPFMFDIEGWSSLSLQARDMKFLEKIEELTLYLIEQNEEIKSLRMKDIQQFAKLTEMNKTINAFIQKMNEVVKK